MKKQETPTPKENQAQLQIYSLAFEEVLTRPPNWLIRRGIGCISILILLFIIYSCLLKLPETISVTWKPSNNKQLQWIVAPNTGTLMPWHTVNGTEVAKEQTLATIQTEQQTIAYINTYTEGRLSCFVQSIKPLTVHKGDTLGVIVAQLTEQEIKVRIQAKVVKKPLYIGQQVKLKGSPIDPEGQALLGNITTLKQEPANGNYIASVILQSASKTMETRPVVYHINNWKTTELIIGETRLIHRIFQRTFRL